MPRPDQEFEAFFSPRGVVLVGASSDPGKLGHGIARNLAGDDFSGAVHFVNPGARSDLLGRPVFRTPTEVPDPVDLAVVVVPASAVPETLAECGERGIKAAIVVSGGFRETGPPGAPLEERCMEIAAEHGMRLLGPNCIGVIDTHSGLNTTFLAPPGPKAGEIAFVSHSGAICAALIDWSGGQGFGVSRLVSLGNRADLDEADALRMVRTDPATRVIAMYLETLGDGREFIREVQAGSQPVVVLKVGRSAAGRSAVVSHTGALAGSDEAFRAAFRRAGVIRVDTIQAMLDASRALASTPLPAGQRVAVLTNAGGPGVTAADAVEAAGLELAVLAEGTRRSLTEALPAGAAVANPVDMLASAAPRDFALCLGRLVSAPEIDGVVVVFPPPPMFAAEEVAAAVIPVIEGSRKPVLVAAMGDRAVQRAVEAFRRAGIPDFGVPERAAAAMAVLAERAEYLTRPAAGPGRPDHIDRDRVEEILGAASDGWLDPATAAVLVQEYGIGVPSGAIARTAEEAVALAGKLSGRVALKLAAPGVVHKTDVGGVRLDLGTPDEIRTAFDELSDGDRPVLVQQMVEPGQDVIVGGIQDPQVGPLIMFGSGGVEVEALRDVEFALAPLTGADLSHLLTHTWAGRRLGGHRGVGPVDRTAVEEVLTRVGWLLTDHPRVREVEINPLRVLPSGARAVDVRARLG